MPAIPAIIGGGVSLVQGILGSRAAKKASETQSEAAARAAAEARAAGERAAADITEAGRTASAGVTDAGTLASVGVTAAGANASRGVTEASRTSASGVRVSSEEANRILQEHYGTTIAPLLQPYQETGAAAQARLAAGIAPGGEFDGSFKPGDLELDPGYQFRLAEGQKALERSAAKAGSLGSGGTLKALTRYSQGVASDEYSKAFERFRTSRNDSFTRLNSLATSGQRAAEVGVNAGTQLVRDAAGNVVRAGEVAANYGFQGARDAGGFETDAATRSGAFMTDAARTGGEFTLRSVGQAGAFTTNAANQAIRQDVEGADARAAGTVASSNAWSGALGGVGRAVQSGFQDYYSPRSRSLRALNG